LVAKVGATGTADTDCAVVRLRHLSELGEVLRFLEACAPVVVDLDFLDRAARQRAFDGLSGVAYAFDATVTRLDDHRCRYLVSAGERRR
jgi:FtsZ-interacting cell division protein YlmF